MDFQNDSLDAIITQLDKEIAETDLILASYAEEQKVIDRIEKKTSYLHRLFKEDAKSNLKKIFRLMRTPGS